MAHRILSLLVLVSLPLLAADCLATDFERLVQTGLVEVTGQARPASVDAPDAASIGLHRLDTDALLFCEAAAPGETAVGLADPILPSGQKIIVQLFAYSEPECVGIRSNGSDDRYRIFLSPTGKPILVKIVAAAP